MNCKNCGARLRLDYLFCPECGAKVVKNRITFRGLFEDILERVFNLENSFYRTLRDMTIRPEKVILKYVEGTRRRYMAPMNYLGLALALSGLTLLILRNYALEKLEYDLIGGGMSKEAGASIMDASMEYNSFIFVLFIPIMALSGWLTLNKREHNIPEYTVTATYILSHYSFLTFPLSLFTTFAFPEHYMKFTFFYLFLMLAYALFAIARTHKYKGVELVGRGILFSLLFIMGFLGLAIVLNIIFILTGIVEFKDVVPQAPETQAGVSSAINWASYNLW